MELKLLQRGSCEPLKASIHATALGLFALMGLYNSAAWLKRRQPHLAVNAILYSALTVWERRHVGTHLRELRRCQATRRAAWERRPTAAAATTAVNELAA
jgi:hypothetical protein